MTTQTQFAVGDRVRFDYLAAEMVPPSEGIKVGTVTGTEERIIPGSFWPRISVRWDGERESFSPVKRYLRLVAPAGPDRIEEMFS